MPNLHEPQLEKILMAYTAALPRQARLIRLAGEVLRHLAAVRVDLPPIPQLSGQEAAAKLSNGEPLLVGLPIPENIFRNTVARLLELFQEFKLLPALAPEHLQALVQTPSQTWLSQPQYLAEICLSQDILPGLLLFLGQKAVSPIYQRAVAPYASLFTPDGWQQTYCPGCGQEPALASLAPGSRHRFLYCSLCAVQWPCDRPACIFCGHQEPRFSYIFAEGDPARRADLCQACRRYLKTIRADRLPHPLYLPLEEYLTVDLDTLVSRIDHTN